MKMFSQIICMFLHKWTEWGEIESSNGFYIDKFGNKHETTISTQRRECLRCKRVEVRGVE